MFCHRYARTRAHHGVLLDPAALPAGLTKPAPEGQKKLMDMGLIPGEPTPAAQLARFVERRLSNGARSCTWPARRGSSNMTMPAGLPGARGVAIVSSNIEPQPAHRSPSSVRVARFHSTRAITRTGLASAPLMASGTATTVKRLLPICDRLVTNWISGRFFSSSAK